MARYGMEMELNLPIECITFIQCNLLMGASIKSEIFLYGLLLFSEVPPIPCDFSIKAALPGASLVAQWLRICLLMQGTRVRALVWEDPTCRGATRPVSHSY